VKSVIEIGVMEFDNDDTRDEYFCRIETDFKAVEYGAALRHAGTVDLGFFGSEDDLFDDCSRIMLAEVNKFSGQANWCRIRDIQFSAIWHMLYESVRSKPKNKMAKVYHDLYGSTFNEALLEESDKLRSRPIAFGESPPHQLVFQSIQRQGRMI